jgi:CheY-like chemotaxis protein
MAKLLHFLLVDDDTDDTLIFRETLQEVNPSIGFTSALNGQEALNILKLENDKLPDLIFLDLNMPRMDGKECLSRLKNDDQLCHIPVIMYTTSSQSKDIEETMLKGAICFITKPTNVRELKNILSQIAQNVRGNLEKSLRTLSNTSSTFIVC